MPDSGLRRSPFRGPATAALALAWLLVAGCSVKKFAVRQIGDALSSGTSTYETDPDVELVGGALPFSLKLVESLLDVTPKHPGLLLSAAKGFTLYSFAYVDLDGEMLMDEDFARGMAQRQRAKRLYLRASGYASRALEAAYPGISEQLESDSAAALTRVRARHVEILYWAGTSLGLSISADPTEPRLLLRLSQVERMLERALQLDESWDRGSLHEFRLRMEAAKPAGGDAQVMRKSFERAAELSGGQRAGLFVSYAEAVAVPAQDRELFDSMLQRALDIDADRHAAYRLLNHLAHRRARWLQSKADDLFL